MPIPVVDDEPQPPRFLPMARIVVITVVVVILVFFGIGYLFGRLFL